MTPVEIGILGMVIMLFFVMLGTYVGYTLMLIGFCGFAMIAGFDAALSNMAILTFDVMKNYHFAVLPLFLLMGAFIAQTGIGREAYESARAWLGHLRGGLAMATVGACGLFAACVGDSLASAVTMGKVAYPEMQRAGYSRPLSAGVIAAGGTIGILIPPSIGFVLIGILAEMSIGKLFIAGIIPGILEVIFYFVTVYIICRINPSAGPPVENLPFREKVYSMKYTWPVAALFLLIIGGIYGGMFTPTEAGGIGAFGALVIGLVRKMLPAKTIYSSMLDTAKTVAMIFVMIIGAFMFNAFLAVTQIPYNFSEWVMTLEISRWAVLFVIIVFYIICGMFFNIWAVLILTIPVIYPAIDKLGFDLIWYSVIVVRVIEIGLVTPPFALNIFGLYGTIDASMGEMYRGIIPFVISDFVHVGLLLMFPALCTWLPSIM